MLAARRGTALLLVVLAAVAAAAVLPALSAAQSGGVLVVGDSLEVGTGPHLRRELAPTPVTIDAKTSRPSSVGLGVLAKELRPGHRVVVFDLGVNDDPSQPGLLARNLEAVRKRVGDRCLVVSTLSRPPLNGVTIDGMNRVITDFVSATPGAQLFDWHDATESDPSLLGPDRLHPGGAGYADARPAAGRGDRKLRLGRRSQGHGFRRRGHPEAPEPGRKATGRAARAGAHGRDAARVPHRAAALPLAGHDHPEHGRPRGGRQRARCQAPSAHSRPSRRLAPHRGARSNRGGARRRRSLPPARRPAAEARPAARISGRVAA